MSNPPSDPADANAQAAKPDIAPSLHSSFFALTSEEDVLAVLNAERTSVLFLRDPLCPVSSAADDELYRAGLVVPTIDVSTQHRLSRLVAERTGIKHESPQVIVLKNGRPAWHASHYAITLEAVRRAVAE